MKKRMISTVIVMLVAAFTVNEIPLDTSNDVTNTYVIEDAFVEEIESIEIKNDTEIKEAKNTKKSKKRKKKTKKKKAKAAKIATKKEVAKPVSNKNSDEISDIVITELCGYSPEPDKWEQAGIISRVEVITISPTIEPTKKPIEAVTATPLPTATSTSTPTPTPTLPQYKTIEEALAGGLKYYDEEYELQKYTIELEDGKMVDVYGYFMPRHEALLFDELSKFRAENGLTIAKGDNQEFANIRAIEACYVVATTGSLSHIRPNKESYSFGENLASGMSVTHEMDMLKASTGHRANMLRTRFNTANIAVFQLVEWTTDVDIRYCPNGGRFRDVAHVTVQLFE